VVTRRRAGARQVAEARPVNSENRKMLKGLKAIRAYSPAVKFTEFLR